MSASHLIRSSGKPILAVDFDGVVHSYEKGWQNGEIYGTLVPGFLAWSVAAARHFRLVVYSSRSKSAEHREAMKAWMRRQVVERLMPNEIDRWLAEFDFAAEKPPAFLTIDDRAIQFRGDWSVWWLQPDRLLKFKPWNVGGGEQECDPRHWTERALEKLSEVGDLIASSDADDNLVVANALYILHKAAVAAAHDTSSSKKEGS